MKVIEAKLDLLLAREGAAKMHFSPEQESRSNLGPMANTEAATTHHHDTLSASLDEGALTDRAHETVKRSIDVLTMIGKVIALPAALVGIYLTWQQVQKTFLEHRKLQAETNLASITQEKVRAELTRLATTPMSDPEFIQRARAALAPAPNTTDQVIGIAVRALLVYACFRAAWLIGEFLEIFWKWLMFGLRQLVILLQKLRKREMLRALEESLKHAERGEQSTLVRVTVALWYVFVVAAVVWPTVLYTYAVIGSSSTSDQIVQQLRKRDLRGAAATSAHAIEGNR